MSGSGGHNNNSNTLTRELINNIMNIKRNINETLRDRIYYKNFSSKVLQLLYELDDVKEKINAEVLLVSLFFIYLREIRCS
jgi:hypothetical protein